MLRFIYVCAVLGSPLCVNPASSQQVAEHSRLLLSAFRVGGEGPEPVFALATPHAPLPTAAFRGTGPRTGTYTWWGGAIGGVAGLTYGLLEGDNTFIAMSPVIETIIGGGIGLTGGGAIDLVQSIR